jgi:uncharacterized protein (UPF0333 family)
MNSKGQGALEYLLIIGGAIVVAVIAVSIIVSISQRNSQNATEKNEQFENFIDNTIIPPMVLNADCNKTAGKVRVIINKSPTPDANSYCLYYEGVPSSASCQSFGTGDLIFTQSIADTSRKQIAISAKKANGAQSSPSSPTFSCVPYE